MTDPEWKSTALELIWQARAVAAAQDAAERAAIVLTNPIDRQTDFGNEEELKWYELFSFYISIRNASHGDDMALADLPRQMAIVEKELSMAAADEQC